MRRALLVFPVLVLVLASSAVEAGTKQWSIEVPQGWEHAPSMSSATLTEIEDAEVLDAEADAFRAPDYSASLVVFSLTVEFPTIASRRTRIESFEAMARSEDELDEVDYGTREVGNHVIVDQIVRDGGDRQHVRRIYAVDAEDRIHVASATCMSERASDACTRVLDTFALTVAGESLDSGSNEMVLRIVIALGILALLLGGFFLLTRRRNS